MSTEREALREQQPRERKDAFVKFSHLAAKALQRWLGEGQYTSSDMHVWCQGYAAALANPTIIRDTDAEVRLKEFAPTLYSWADQDIVPGVLKPLLRDVADTIERLASSTPAEPREASGYCPYCMTADPAEPDYCGIVRVGEDFGEPGETSES